MDSTARLVGSDAANLDLPLHLRAAGQRDMEEDNPIARHGKVDVRLVAARLFFFRLGKPRTHSRMRHVSFDQNVRSSNGFAGGIGRFESDRRGTDPRRLG